MREQARAVVIGGGVGGCAILYWLARLGWDDVVLVERAELTSGSTFHSAGLVGQLRSSLSLTKMVNPYLAFAAIIAAGLHGIENELELSPALDGNAYEFDAKRFPSALREATAARVGHDGADGLRGPGRRPLPELRAHPSSRSTTRS